MFLTTVILFTIIHIRLIYFRPLVFMVFKRSYLYFQEGAVAKGRKKTAAKGAVALPVAAKKKKTVILFTNNKNKHIHAIYFRLWVFRHLKVILFGFQNICLFRKLPLLKAVAKSQPVRVQALPRRRKRLRSHPMNLTWTKKWKKRKTKTGLMVISLIPAKGRMYPNISM